MIGQLNREIAAGSDAPEVTIIGAGIAGLLAAYYLDKAGWTVHLIEAQSRPGGMLETTKTSFGISEAAAHSIPASPTVQKLFDELGVELLPLNREAKSRYILRNGKLRKFPLSIFQALRAFINAYFKLAPAAKDPEELTLADWAAYFFGKPALQYLITPFTRGIFGAEPDEINVSAAFPTLCVPRGHSFLSYLLSKKMRRNPAQAVRRAQVVVPRGKISAPDGGMGAWIYALSSHLDKRLGERFHRGRKVESLKEFESSKNLILAVPAQEASRFLKSESTELSSALAQVSYSPLVTATIFVPSNQFRRRPRGLGVLMPASEPRQCLGVLFNSSSFENRVKSSDIISLTMMLGGSRSLKLLEKSDEELQKIIVSELRDTFGMKGEPSEIRLKRWTHAVPKYNHELLKTWELAEKTWCSKPGRILFGNYTGQVSLRGMVELASKLT
jgi:protoporphyrinogen/coproporphyrinogen III oxidase